MRRKARLLWLPLFDLKSYRTRVAGLYSPLQSAPAASQTIPRPPTSSRRDVHEGIPSRIQSLNEEINCLLINTAFLGAPSIHSSWHPSIHQLYYSRPGTRFLPSSPVVQLNVSTSVLHLLKQPPHYVTPKLCPCCAAPSHTKATPPHPLLLCTNRDRSLVSIYISLLPSTAK